ncbi:MAG: hypothetical protein ACP5R2_11720 [Anaerolineae bacterium]
MAKPHQKEMPIPANGWASLHCSPTHTPMRPTEPPTRAHVSMAHPHCQTYGADLILGALAYCAKARQFLAHGNRRCSRLCLEHALRCLERALKEMLE